ncbi:MAG: (2Fe-2S)-binding protein [Gemmatimonadaceae bacterium]|nr:(2Fe-2S)-binding protein [Gemmatimonadaceae bacterium]
MPAFTLNGRLTSLPTRDHDTLLDALRDHAGLPGTKLACDRGECGACTVLVDGRPTYACITLAAQVAGRSVTTIEGIGTDAAPHPVQAAFVRHDAAQCGYCTPGQVMAAVALLEATPHPSDEEIRAGMSGNLCRCGTYPRIAAALRELAANGTTPADSAQP